MKNKTLSKKKLLKLVLMEGDKQVAYFSLPLTKGYVKILNKWLNLQYEK